MATVIQPIVRSSWSSILSLNNQFARETSYLTEADLAKLIDEAVFAESAGANEAFLIAFDQAAKYKSPNFLWFKKRYPRFAYVDRIITAVEAQGKGHARALYEALFERARNNGLPLVCCEVNTVPPNPGSDAFHLKMGFEEVGRATHSPEKSVRYLTKPV